MDATSNKKSKRRKGRRHRHRRESSPSSSSTDLEQPDVASMSPPLSQRTDSLPTRVEQNVENKMGLPPPYEQSQPNPAPPPSYFGDNPPPPPGFMAPAAAPRTTVITNQGSSGSTEPNVKLGPGRTGTTCASCNKNIVTRVEYVPNNRTHIVSAALCVLAGCCCGCFIPYCMKSCKTANHYCPKCRAFVGSYTPS